MLGDQGGMRLALTAIESFVAGAMLELAGEFMTTDPLACGQIWKRGLPADGLGAAGAKVPYRPKEGQRQRGGDRHQNRVEQA
jgi:hypothetical protein